MRDLPQYQRPASAIHEDMVRVLHDLLRDELTAAKSYDQAMNWHALGGIPALKENRNSHYSRIVILKAQIQALAGVPELTAHSWQRLSILDLRRKVKMYEILSVLQIGEDQTLSDYYHALTRLDADGREVIAGTLLPAQIDSCYALSQVGMGNSRLSSDRDEIL